MQVEILDENHQRFNGRTYRKNKRGWYQSTRGTLHRAVWKFHHGEIPKGYDIHHVDFDKSNNDVSNLRMLTRLEHRRLHSVAHEIICEVCGQPFNAVRAKYCPKCRAKSKPKRLDEFVKLMNAAGRRIKSISNRLRTCEVCGKTFEYKHNRTCSRECGAVLGGRTNSGREKVERVITVCEFCGKEIRHRASNPQRFCSQACLFKFMTKSRPQTKKPPG